MSKELTLTIQQFKADGTFTEHVKLIDSEGFIVGTYRTVEEANKAAQRVWWSINRGKANLKTINKPRFGSFNPALYNNSNRR